MLDISTKKLNLLKKKFSGKRIAVIGDLMLDCYYQGAVTRVSPEAPVPVVEIDHEFFRFGGAMNVALNIQTLGGIPLPLGVIGKDNDGDTFRNLLKDTGISDEGIVVDKNRPTTAKTRVIGNKQHVVRIDKESTAPIDKKIEAGIIRKVEKHLPGIDGIILEDYNKGVLTPSLIKKIISMAKEAGKIITVDPKFLNFFAYNDVTVFKPNRKESEDALGMKIKNRFDLETAGTRLLEKLDAKYVLLTLGEEGISLFEKNKPVRTIPTKARKIADVSGAGDTVISTLTMALAAGADIYDAAYLANFAGGLVCQEVGIVPIDQNYLFNIVSKEIQ